MNGESRRLRQIWTNQELLVVLDMYINGKRTDSHRHDGFAKCLGRYNPHTRSYGDGAVNQKLAEIKGQVEASRTGRHPGEAIVHLIQTYKNDKKALRADAIRAWQNILIGHTGSVPPYVRDLLG